MQPFTTLTAVAAPMPLVNVNTDAIFPVAALPGRDGSYGERLFGNWRYRPDGSERPEFVLNQPRFREARIMVGGTNFGCGSSRETAVWALAGFGIRCVIAPSFGDIFAHNAFQNGVLVVALPVAAVDDLLAQLQAAAKPIMTVDLEAQTLLAPDGTLHPFEIAPERREALLRGMSQLDLLRAHVPDIELFEARARQASPWAYPH